MTAASQTTSAVDDRRHYARIAFKTPAQLVSAAAALDVVVIDLSLKGALVRLPANAKLQAGTICGSFRLFWTRKRRKTMKRLIADIHMHTLASGHAYGTIREMAAAAKEQQLQLIGISEHAPGTPERWTRSITGTCA